MFPDAPTERGVKHVNELIRASQSGFGAYIIFVIQIKGVLYFTPNDNTHREFGEALKNAAANGVHILAYDCFVGKDCMENQEPVEVRLRSKVNGKACRTYLFLVYRLCKV